MESNVSRGERIITTIRDFVHACDEYKNDEQSIKEYATENKLPVLHRDEAHNPHTMEENCNNMRAFNDLYTGKYSRLSDGYEALGDYAKHETTACMDSYIDVLDGFLNDKFARGIEDDANYKDVSGWVNHFLSQAHEPVFCSNKVKYRNIEEVIGYVLNNHLVTSYISGGKTKSDKTTRRGLVEEAINDNLGSAGVTLRSGKRLDTKNLEFDCFVPDEVIDEGPDENLLPPRDIPLPRAMLQINTIYLQKDRANMLQKWRSLRTAEMSGGDYYQKYKKYKRLYKNIK